MPKKSIGTVLGLLFSANLAALKCACDFFLRESASACEVSPKSTGVGLCVRSAILSSQLFQLLACNMMLFALPRYLFVKVIGHVLWAQKGIVILIPYVKL